MTPLQLVLIEDEVIIAENMRQSLTDLGYEVMEVCNSYDEAIHAIKNQSYDLVIMDINLGDPHGRTGLDLARELKEIKPSPFIFITAYSDLDTISKASQLMPSAYLVKPVNDKTMFSTIQVAFQNYSNNLSAVKPEDKVSESVYFYTKIGSKNYKVNWKDVYLVRAVKNYVEIKTSEYTSTFLLRTSLTNCMESLMPSNIRAGFVKINRAEAIRADIINIYDHQSVSTSYGDFRISAEAQGAIEKMVKK